MGSSGEKEEVSVHPKANSEQNKAVQEKKVVLMSYTLPRAITVGYTAFLIFVRGTKTLLLSDFAPWLLGDREAIWGCCR